MEMWDYRWRKKYGGLKVDQAKRRRAVAGAPEEEGSARSRRREERRKLDFHCRLRCVVQKHGDRATGEPRFRRIGATGEDARHAAAEHDSGQLGAAQIFKLLSQHVAALQIGDHEDVGLAGDGRDQLLDAGGLFADGGVEGQRAVEDAAGDLAAVGHLAERGGVECGLDLGVHVLDGREQRHLGFGNSERVGQLDRILDDVNLVFKLGLDVDGGVCDEQRTGVSRRVHDEDVGDAAGGAQAEFLVQGGLIHQQRHQYTEATARFQKAIAIDPTLTDAHFQLGRMAREQGRLRDALAHFQTVIGQDERHSFSETLRELGGIYVAARQYADARNEFAIYTERRPYDPEGLYYYGQSLEGLAETAAARDAYARAVEADRTAPRYRRRYTARWSRLAQKQLGKLAVA